MGPPARVGPVLPVPASCATIKIGGKESSREENVPLNIKDEDTHRAARELARIRGTTITNAVAAAVQEALTRERERRSLSQADLVTVLDEIALHCAGLPVADARSPEEIIGYDRDGLPR